VGTGQFRGLAHRAAKAPFRVDWMAALLLAALRQLVACGLAQEAEVLADADLASLRSSLG